MSSSQSKMFFTSLHFIHIVKHEKKYKKVKMKGRKGEGRDEEGWAREGEKGQDSIPVLVLPLSFVMVEEFRLPDAPLGILTVT